MRRQSYNVYQLVKNTSDTVFFLGILGALVVCIFGIWSIENEYRNPNPNPIRVPKPKTGADYPPILAYTIFGSNGDSERMLRILKSIYHPRNQYLLYLDVLSPNSEREKLRRSVESQEEFQAFQNVHVSKDYVPRPIGDSSLPSLLHASSLLLELHAEWDWFTALSSSDYPLIPQDDILYMLSFLPRHLNFIQYPNRNVSDESDGEDGVNDNVLDPAAFKIYRGSPWMILSRNFIAHSMLISPVSDITFRKIMKHFINLDSPLETYFHTVMCNTPEFQNTIVNTDFRYSLLETRNPKAGILERTRPHDELVLGTPAVFARPYEEGDPLLEEIDAKILNRSLEGVAPGNWCIEPHTHETNNHPTIDYTEYFDHFSSPCSTDSVKPGKYGIHLREMFSVDVENLLDQCQSFQHTLASFT